jgi:trk system potassium uptake protein TrkA
LDVDKFDSAIISTGSDEHAAILITLHLKELGCANTIVKAENEDHGRILKAVGANKIIFPEDEMAKKLALSLSNPNLLDFIPLGDDYTVAEIAPPKQFHGKSIMDLQLRQKYKVEIIAIKGEASSQFKYMTPPNYVFQPSDTIICIGKFEDLEKIKEAK